MHHGLSPQSEFHGVSGRETLRVRAQIATQIELHIEHRTRVWKLPNQHQILPYIYPPSTLLISTSIQAAVARCLVAPLAFRCFSAG